MKNRFAVLAVLTAAPLLAQQSSNPAVDALLDKIVAREQGFLESMQKRAPLIETYIQAYPLGEAGESQDAYPIKDHYFLWRFRLGNPIRYDSFIERTDAPPPPPAPVTKKKGKESFKNRSQSSAAATDQPSNGGPLAIFLHPFRHNGKKSALNQTPEVHPFAFLPRGFVQMTVLDMNDFNRKTYNFEYVRKEFLGEVRCLVFDVTPVNPDDVGRFVGRIWVEDRDYSIVRFNGSYLNSSGFQAQAPIARAKAKHGWFGRDKDQTAKAPDKNASTQHATVKDMPRYFHFESWRVNVAGSEWVPAEIYVEEEGIQGSDPGQTIPKFKAISRIWDYAAVRSGGLDELTSIQIENKPDVKDTQANDDPSPLESQRAWEREAEDNVMARLQKAGLMAPPGPVDDVLNAVVNNLIISANLNVEVRCRVLLTLPLETFTVGRTIVISRGLTDVLPDEASLAVMLADGLSQIVLGYQTPTQFSFNDRTMVDDVSLLSLFHFQRTPEQLAAAAKKTIEIISTSPYKNTANAGLFLKALSARGPALKQLLQPSLGDQVANADVISARLAALPVPTPDLDEKKVDQIAALPLGSRIRLDPWANNISMIKPRPISILSPREKLPFEITPVVLHLTRKEALKPVAEASPSVGQANQ